jgi:hypothetical protein
LLLLLLLGFLPLLRCLRCRTLLRLGLGGRGALLLSLRSALLLGGALLLRLRCLPLPGFCCRTLTLGGCLLLLLTLSLAALRGLATLFFLPLPRLRLLLLALLRGPLLGFLLARGAFLRGLLTLLLLPGAACLAASLRGGRLLLLLLLLRQPLLIASLASRRLTRTGLGWLSGARLGRLSGEALLALLGASLAVAPLLLLLLLLLLLGEALLVASL